LQRIVSSRTLSSSYSWEGRKGATRSLPARPAVPSASDGLRVVGGCGVSGPSRSRVVFPGVRGETVAATAPWGNKSFRACPRPGVAFLRRRRRAREGGVRRCRLLFRRLRRHHLGDEELLPTRFVVADSDSYGRCGSSESGSASISPWRSSTASADSSSERPGVRPRLMCFRRWLHPAPADG